MSTGQPTETHVTAAKRPWLLWGSAGLIVVLAGLAVWHWTQTKTQPEPVAQRAEPAARGGPPPDPRMAFPTPYLNVRADVPYVGSAACAKCHATITASFRHHPMGRSAATAAEMLGDWIGLWPAGQEPFPAAPQLASRLAQLEHYNVRGHDPFDAVGLVHRVEPRGNQIFHGETRYDALRQVVGSFEAPVLLAIGSGTRGRSYVVARDDALVQSPISWYSQKSRWDLSPGYEYQDSHFERPIAAECLYCHTNQVKPITGSANRFEAPLVRGHAIGCERCHGPGKLHVDSRKSGRPPENPELTFDPTIVNPVRLEPYLREGICEQCHLQGRVSVARAGRQLFDYRPGLPYHLFWSVFVLPDEQSDHHKSVTTVEQMHASKCFQKSGGALGCISCHDPHELPSIEEKVAFYRQRCQQCHSGKRPAVQHGPALPHAPDCSEALSVRRQKGDSCIACHMAPLTSSDVAHTANTDHRVPRRPDETRADPTPPREPAAGPPLVHFHRDLVTRDDKGTSRDYGIALIRFALHERDPNAARQALPLLEAALREWPDDLAALEARANALGALGRVDDGVAAYEALVVKAPNQENYLLVAAQLAERMDRLPQAADYYRRVLAINPHQASAHAKLGRVLAASRDWQGAAHELEAGLRLNPFDVDARQQLVYAYVHLGQRVRAREEFGRLLGLNPARPDLLKEWFDRQLR